MNLFEQLSAAAAAAKALKQPEARFLHATTTASFPLTTPTTYTPSHPYRQPRLWHVKEALRIP